MQAFCLILAVFLAFIIPQIDENVKGRNTFWVGQLTLIIIAKASKSNKFSKKLDKNFNSGINAHLISHNNKLSSLNVRLN